MNMERPRRLRRETREMSVQPGRYRSGPVMGLFVPKKKKLYRFDDFIMARQVKRMLTIGRGEFCDIRLDDSRVSRVHCEITRYRDGACKIADTESTNGLFVNDVRVAHAQLWPGMWIFLGQTELVAVGLDGNSPVIGRNYTSFLINAKYVHGSAESAASAIHRSAATIYRAIERRLRRRKGTA